MLHDQDDNKTMQIDKYKYWRDNIIYLWTTPRRIDFFIPPSLLGTTVEIGLHDTKVTEEG